MSKRFRGIPAPPNFSLSALTDDVQLTEIETAAVLRESIVGVSKKRLAGADGLEWRYINGRPRCVVGSLKKKLAGSDLRLPSVKERVIAKKKKVAAAARADTVGADAPRRSRVKMQREGAAT